MAARFTLLVLHTFCIIGALADPLMLAIKSSQDSQGLVRFLASSDGTDFAMDTTSNELSVSTCRNGNTNLTFSSRTQGGFPGSAKMVTVKCTRKSTNLLGLAPGPQQFSLPSQLFKSQKGLLQTMAFCLSSSRTRTGELSFGRSNHVLYVGTDILQARTASLIRIPLVIGGTGSYQIKLTGVGISSVHQKLTQSTMISISLTSRYTTLPAAAYSIIRKEVEATASTKKVGKESTKFGELNLCFKTNTTNALRIFPNVTLEFGSSKATWTVSPLNYLVPKPGAKNIVCFAMKPASEKSLPVIGSFQQEDNWVEFNFQNKTLGVSGSQVAQFNLGCDSTHGS